jgi:signal transduction histidine kinase
VRLIPGHDSLGRRLLTWLIIGELLFAVVLGTTIGVFSLVTLTRDHERAVRDVATVVAASVMPAVADQQLPQVEAQIASILETTGIRDILGVCVIDAAGQTIICEGEEPYATGTRAPEPENLWAMLTEARTVEQPVVVEGLRVATVRVRFAPPSLLDTLGLPAAAVLVLVASTVLISVPWTSYIMTRDVVEPLGDLMAQTRRVAAGDLDDPATRRSPGELGDLEEAFGGMALQLQERERELRQSYDEVTEAYGSLDRAKREIEELATIKENFVAIAAHEIRGPLSTIRLYADLLEAGEEGALDQPALEAVSIIGSAASRLSSIASDLMDSALLERGLMVIEFGDVWLGTLVEEAVRDANALAAAVGKRVLFSGRLPDAVVRGDAVRLRQVIDNLLSNAVKYSPEDSEAVVSALEGVEWIDIDVADRGRGVPAGSRDRLFALFGRVDFGESRDIAGLGLGLAISARIVEGHGGRIGYRENEGGRGSVFSVRLPLTEAARARSGRLTVEVLKEGGSA